MKRKIFIINLIIVLLVSIICRSASASIINYNQDYLTGYYDGYQFGREVGQRLAQLPIKEQLNRAWWEGYLSYRDTKLPERWEVKEFLTQDKTNQCESQDVYVCLDYAMELANNARQNKLICNLVFIYYDNNYCHAVVCFPTTEGKMYIEPQNDLEINDVTKYIIWRIR